MGHKKWVKKLGERRRAARGETEKRNKRSREKRAVLGIEPKKPSRLEHQLTPPICIYSALQLLAGMLSAKCFISFGAKLSTPGKHFPDSRHMHGLFPGIICASHVLLEVLKLSQIGRHTRQLMPEPIRGINVNDHAHPLHTQTPI
jgi:hypothetical protein